MINLFASISRYMRPFFFFFLFTIIVTLVNPSINRQIQLQQDRVQMGREGDIYVYAQLLQRDNSVAASWDGENHFRGACPSGGVWRADYMHLELSCTGLRGWLSQAGVELGAEGVWAALGALPAHVDTGSSRHRPAGMMQGGGRAFWEEKVHPGWWLSPTLGGGGRN